MMILVFILQVQHSLRRSKLANNWSLSFLKLRDVNLRKTSSEHGGNLPLLPAESGSMEDEGCLLVSPLPVLDLPELADAALAGLLHRGQVLVADVGVEEVHGEDGGVLEHLHRVPGVGVLAEIEPCVVDIEAAQVGLWPETEAVPGGQSLLRLLHDHVPRLVPLLLPQASVDLVGVKESSELPVGFKNLVQSGLLEVGDGVVLSAPEHLAPQLEAPLGHLDQDDAAVDEVADVHVFTDDQVSELGFDHDVLQLLLVVDEDSVGVHPDQIVVFLQQPSAAC